jgi:hypothetical protein
MLIFMALLVASGLALTTPTLAQEEVAAFEYSAVVKLTRSGQFQAEVWRRDVSTGQRDLVWSKRDSYPTLAAAEIEACTALTKYFDETFSCLRAAPQKAAQHKAAAKPSDPSVTRKSAVRGKAAKD